MERTSNKARWKKTGGGTLTLSGNRVIQPGQVFRAREDEIPESFRDVVHRVEEAKEEPKAPPKSNLEIKHVGGGWYDLINTETGEAINYTSLRKKQADEFKTLTAEEAVEILVQEEEEE